MALTFCSFSSGSSGNCYLVRSEKTAILIDAGISGRKTIASLSRVALEPKDLDALLVTHEHSDHVKSLGTLAKKMPQMYTYANGETWKNIEHMVPEKQRKIFKTGEIFFINEIKVRSFLLSHDAAEPVGFSFCLDGKQISILTDTGILSTETHDEIMEADLLILEANHDIDMLRVSRYPWFLKQRILGAKGHLSNTDAADVICRILSEKEKYRHVLLAHLSRENNFPEMAYQTIKNILAEKNYHIDTNLCLSIIKRDEMSAIYVVD